ncbi:MAG: flagellar motor protein MotB [Deltaproteobacteria bacterium]|nr:flagellar motor protein MotB [Deltaproteobacteria bacterium]
MDDEHYSYLEMFDDEGQQPWLITFADMVSLLMSMFVLLYSLSSLNEKKFHDVMVSVQQSLVGMVKDSQSGPPIKTGESVAEPDQTEKPVQRPAPDHTKLLDDLKEFVNTKETGQPISISVDGANVILRVEGQALFASGEAKLDPQALPVLDEIIKTIKNNPLYRVNIKGHTDNIPISTPQIPSNWELSAIRSTTVLRYLLSKGVSPNRLTATGYADLLPVAPNDTLENRAKNRRVEFVLEKEEKN